MDIYIFTEAIRNESTRISFRLADLCTDAGHSVTLITSDDWKPRALHPRWDSTITSFNCLYERLVTCDMAIWPDLARPELVQLFREQGIKTVVTALWQHSCPSVHGSLSLSDYVLAPTPTIAKWVRKNRGMPRGILRGWDPGSHRYRSEANIRSVKDPFKIIWPMHDREPYHTEYTAVALIDRVLKHCPQVHVTVLYNSATIRSAAKKRFVAWSKAGRATLRSTPPWHELSLLYAQHDLTFWPTHAENTCTTGLESVAASTPVLAFKFPPVDEHLSERNAILIPCEFEMTQYGVPRATPNYDTMEQVLYDLVEQPTLLDDLVQTVLHDENNRCVEFTKSFDKLLA